MCVCLFTTGKLYFITHNHKLMILTSWSIILLNEVVVIRLSNGNMKICYCVHKSLQLDSVQIQFYPDHSHTSMSGSPK
jgi:hypothetical protein